MTPESLPREPWFHELEEALAAHPLASRVDDPREIKEAAVALILRAGAPVDLLLIRRAEMEGDPWSGHMALPGGRRDPEDPDSIGTAVRETVEEIGLDLNSRGRYLGKLSDLVPGNPRLPPLRIIPHVFAIRDAGSLQLSTREVEEVVWAPLESLTDPETNRTVPIDLGYIQKEFPAFVLNDRVVWGLTHRILSEFLHILAPLRHLP